MVLPALELYTDGLMTDHTMYDAFVAQSEQVAGSSAPDEGEQDDDAVPARG
jgi:hypothetical protein